jgi:hypothetical protein
LLIVKRHGGSLPKSPGASYSYSATHWFSKGNPVRSAAPFAIGTAGQSASQRWRPDLVRQFVSKPATPVKQVVVKFVVWCRNKYKV